MKRLIVLFLLTLVYSCATIKDVVYFQNIEDGQVNTLPQEKAIRLQPDDKISIIVNSKDPLLVNLFNLPIAEPRITGQSNDIIGTSSSKVSGYTLDKEGNIEFPVLGKINIEGKTRQEVADYIKQRLITEELVKDPTITVEFANLAISVMGEVTKPGRYSIDRDKVTILDAISMAQDLTIHGRRENVTVIREKDGKQTFYKVNFLDAKSITNSPVYYLQQNDVVYVEPNDMRARQSTVNGNNIHSTSFWISVTSLLTSVSLLFIR